MPESRPQGQSENGHVAKSFTDTGAGHTFRSRLVHNSNLPHIVSSNWRLDFYKFKKLSCAEVKNDRVNSGIQHNYPSCVTTRLA